MKSIIAHINEAYQEAHIIKFLGSGFKCQKEQEFKTDAIILSREHHDTLWDAQVKSINDIDTKDLLKQGVKYLLMFPPHKTQSGDEVDHYIIKMFIRRKHYFDIYKSSEKYLMYDLKNKKFINDKEIRAYKITRLD